MFPLVVLVALVSAPCDDGVCFTPGRAVLSAPVKVVEKVVEVKPVRGVASASVCITRKVLRARPARRVVSRVYRRPRLRRLRACP